MQYVTILIAFFFPHVHACTYTLTSFKAIYVNAHEFKNVLVSNK